MTGSQPGVCVDFVSYVLCMRACMHVCMHVGSRLSSQPGYYCIALHHVCWMYVCMYVSRLSLSGWLMRDAGRRQIAYV